MSRQIEIKPGDDTLSSREVLSPTTAEAATKTSQKKRRRRQTKQQLLIQESATPNVVEISNVDTESAVSITSSAPEQISLLEKSTEQIPIVECDSTEAEALNVKGINFARVQDFKAALECFEQAIKLSPNHSRAWYNRGMGLVTIGAPKDEALFCFSKALEIDPYDAEAWNNKGVVLAMLDNEFDAMICYERALELKPGYSRAWANKGALFLKMGNRKAAKECIDKSS
jgi:tetratricopeptide (TPR) repeat protein